MTVRNTNSSEYPYLPYSETSNWSENNAAYYITSSLPISHLCQIDKLIGKIIINKKIIIFSLFLPLGKFFYIVLINMNF